MDTNIKRSVELDTPSSEGKQAGTHGPATFDLSRSRSPSPPPSSDSLSNLHRVTDMLKDKLNSRRDFVESSQDHNSSSSHPDPRKSPFHLGTPSSAKSPLNGGCTVPGTMESYIPHHHMSALLGNDMYHPHNNESSNVLRGILQGKADRLDAADSDKHSMRSSSKRFSELYGRMNSGRDQDVVAKNGGSVGGDSDVESFRSGSPGNMSFDDSDPDRRMNGVSDMDEIIGEADKDSMTGDNEDSFMGANNDDDVQSDEESSEMAKARLDSLRDGEMSPSGKCNSVDLTPPERRQKRKQYIPQQHGSMEPSPKVRKVEKETLQKQLRQMQQQLAMMQQRYCELYDNGEVPDIAGIQQSDENEENKSSVYSKCKNSEKSQFLNPMASLDFDPSHFIKQASKLVQEQELLSKRSDGLLGNKSPSDMQNLARMLKEELSHSVSSLVDNVVAKFVEKHQKLPSLHQTVVPPVEKPKKERVPTPVEPEPIKLKSPTPSTMNNNNNNNTKDLSSNMAKFTPTSHSGNTIPQEPPSAPKPPRTKVTDKIGHPFFDFHPKPFAELARAHPALFPPPPYFHTHIPQIQPLYAKEPEQTEAMSLVLGTPTKKKRTKVTDTRLSPRAARALLQESIPHSSASFDGPKHGAMMSFADYGHPPLIPMSLPTSVAIPNPSLQHSDILAMYSNSDHPFGESSRRGQSPSTSPSMLHPNMMDSFHHSMKDMENFDHMMAESFNFDGNHSMTTTLTPMHLRKAKLMFFYVRYPSSSILKIYFPDIKFNKNNTAQLVKWFSNFREFYYIQMEKYSRQALAEGVKNAEDMVVTLDSELYRILNLHYNRNNQIDVPDAFRHVVQATLREFFKAIQGGKDSEQSWKKAIYKIIARMDDTLPDYFKSPNWMEQLNDA